MKQRFDFDDIRPLYDEEVHEVMTTLVEEPAVTHFLKYIAPEVPVQDLTQTMLGMQTKREFQQKIVAPFLMKLAQKTTQSLEISGVEALSLQDSYTYISNHRDIILDAAFLNILLFAKGHDTAEVAIGDNLLIYPWIRNLVRMNKSFIVKRDMPVRQLLEASRRLSTYIHFALKIKGQSVWISQREGRSKDSTDRTQEGLIKMLAMGGGKDLLRSLRSLNFAPVSISYEYDPCDYLKAKEFQQKRDDASFKKTKQDDMLNMETGLVGYKGNVHFHVSADFVSTLVDLPADMEKGAIITTMAARIDREIHRNMTLYPGNYVAYDLLHGEKYTARYTAEEKKTFEAYLQGQINKVDLPNRDDAFIRAKLLEMYANTVVNYEVATR